MPELKHCHECGRRLRNVMFCPHCGQWLCSSACLDAHAAREALLTRASGELSKPWAAAQEQKQ